MVWSAVYALILVGVTACGVIIFYGKALVRFRTWKEFDVSSHVLPVWPRYFSFSLTHTHSPVSFTHFFRGSSIRTLYRAHALCPGCRIANCFKRTQPLPPREHVPSEKRTQLGLHTLQGPAGPGSMYWCEPP